MQRGKRLDKLAVHRISDEMLLRDIVRVYDKTGSSTSDTYRAHGRYALASIVVRFGKWRHALRRAGIPCKRNSRIPHDTDESDGSDFVPLATPKARKCLGCGVAIVSINYTCGNCYASNSTAVLADGWEVVAG